LTPESPPDISYGENNQVHCPILTGRSDQYPFITGSNSGAGVNDSFQALQDLITEFAEPEYPDFMARSPAELVSLLEDGGLTHELALDKDKILAEYDLRALTTTNHLLPSNKRLLLEHLFHVLGLDNHESNTELVRLAFSQGLNLRELLAQGISTLMENDYDFNRRISNGLANPYANSLRFKRFATLDAFLSNALAIGYHIPDLYCLKKPSTFWRPEIKSVSDLRGDLAASYMRLPPHLRPTSLQIKRSHKPYIDLLPFPNLRMRIISAITQEPPAIDEFDLKHDIMHDGVICWSGGRPSAGQPWDMRSWEIAPWFKRKWEITLFSMDTEN
jgi:Domain of unknown function (DUF3425)